MESRQNQPNSLVPNLNTLGLIQGSICRTGFVDQQRSINIPRIMSKNSSFSVYQRNREGHLANELRVPVVEQSVVLVHPQDSAFITQSDERNEEVRPIIFRQCVDMEERRVTRANLREETKEEKKEYEDSEMEEEMVYDSHNSEIEENKKPEENENKKNLRNRNNDSDEEYIPYRATRRQTRSMVKSKSPKPQNEDPSLQAQNLDPEQHRANLQPEPQIVESPECKIRKRREKCELDPEYTEELPHGKYRCRKCNKKFGKRYNARDHENVEKGIKPYLQFI